MLFMFPYLLWGMRNGTCHVSVYLLFLGIPSEYWVVLYIIGKVFMRRSQHHCNCNCRKWFSSGGEIPITSLMIMDLRGELILDNCLGLLVVWMVVYSYLRRFHGLCEKGDGSFIWKSIQRIQESWVNIGLPLIFPISFLPHYGFW